MKGIYRESKVGIKGWVYKLVKKKIGNAEMDVGQSYRFHTYGYRIDILWTCPITTGIEKIG